MRFVEKLDMETIYVWVEAVGFSGGIWVFWIDNLFIDIIQTHPQFILLRVQQGRSSPWFFSIAYVSPSPILRKRLWQDLC